jgi:transposase
MIPTSVRIFVCAEPQDMRRSFDALALAAQDHLGETLRAALSLCSSTNARIV